MNLTLLLGSSDSLAGFAPMDNALGRGDNFFVLETVENHNVIIHLSAPGQNVMEGITTLEDGDLFLNVPYGPPTVNGLSELQGVEADFKSGKLSASSQADLTATDGSSKITFSFQVAGSN